jgi:hypothetical protein
VRICISPVSSSRPGASATGTRWLWCSSAGMVAGRGGRSCFWAPAHRELTLDPSSVFGIDRHVGVQKRPGVGRQDDTVVSAAAGRESGSGGHRGRRKRHAGGVADAPVEPNAGAGRRAHHLAAGGGLTFVVFYLAHRLLQLPGSADGSPAAVAADLVEHRHRLLASEICNGLGLLGFRGVPSRAGRGVRGGRSPQRGGPGRR